MGNMDGLPEEVTLSEVCRMSECCQSRGDSTFPEEERPGPADTGGEANTTGKSAWEVGQGWRHRRG
jgi:hypothetical protein